VAEVLPLFPLSQTVLFPGVALPLHVFEERYRELVRTLLARQDGPRRFGVVAIRQGWEVGPDAVRALHGVGCAAELRRVSRYPDGRYDIVTVGTARFRLLGMARGALPYLVGEVEWLPAADPPDAEAALLAGHVRVLFERYLAALAGLGDAAAAEPEPLLRPTDLPADPDALSYLVGSITALPLDDRQALLEVPDATARLRAELRLLKRETTMLRRLRALPASVAELRVEQSLS
jgi:Lon protease-like protein